MPPHPSLRSQLGVTVRGACKGVQPHGPCQLPALKLLKILRSASTHVCALTIVTDSCLQKACGQVCIPMIVFKLFTSHCNPTGLVRSINASCAFQAQIGENHIVVVCVGLPLCSRLSCGMLRQLMSGFCCLISPVNTACHGLRQHGCSMHDRTSKRQACPRAILPLRAICFKHACVLCRGSWNWIPCLLWTRQ